MTRFGRIAGLVTAIALGSLLTGGLPSSTVRAAAPDKSDVVLALDFSASILNDTANREKFADALDSMADRVDATSADLVAGDATMSLVQFAAKAADVPGCTELHLLDSPETVGKFADCLRTVAAAYRKGLDPALSNKIGIDTNYVAAMQQADKHLPDDAIRPALILFTDGKHDVAGTPVSQVQVVRDKLFGKRTPFALLPVGMGLDSKERAALEAGLVNMRITRDMPACVSGATFDWPQVVFDSADQAGGAVAVALQDATCTFTVAATPGPSVAPTATPEPSQAAAATPAPTPTAAPVVPAAPPAAPGQPSVAAGNGAVIVTVVPPPAAPGALAASMHVECSPDGGATWPQVADIAAGAEPTVQLPDLANGTEYVCRAFAVNAIGQSEASPISAAARPCSSALDCNPVLAPVLGILGLALLIGILAVIYILYKGRQRGYVLAVVDVVHTANLGYGSTIGIGFVRDPVTKQVTDVVSDKGASAEIRIRHNANGFEVTDRHGRRVTPDGEPIMVTDALGARHEIVLRAFATNAASPVATRH